uniref:Uncharacterized protein n=1 Tax=Timema tahoe TaxID=61484 RepID=A0A7R9P1Z7_9NEOP|nr:unnamed protein product [Timema tahoe]
MEPYLGPRMLTLVICWGNIQITQNNPQTSLK